LAKIKNFKDEKETIAIAKTPGTEKNRKVIEGHDDFAQRYNVRKRIMPQATATVVVGL